MAWSLFTPSRKWDDITSQISVPVTSGIVRMQRDGHIRRLTIWDLRFTASGSGTFIPGLAAADRPAFPFPTRVQGLSDHLRVTPVGNVMGYSWSADVSVYGQLWWSTEGEA